MVPVAEIPGGEIIKHPMVPAWVARELETENKKLRDQIMSVRALGEVYAYPDGWDCASQGGHPPVDAYEKINLDVMFAV